MRTTVRLRDDLLRRAKKRAADEGRTLTSMIEEGLLIVLGNPQPRRSKRPVKIPVSKATGGVLPGIDLNNSGEIWDILDGV